jgi:hypothetical protein
VDDCKAETIESAEKLEEFKKTPELSTPMGDEASDAILLSSMLFVSGMPNERRSKKNLNFQTMNERQNGYDLTLPWTDGLIWNLSRTRMVLYIGAQGECIVCINMFAQTTA